MKAIKSYWAFTSWKYRLVMFVAVPFIFFMIQGFHPNVEFLEEADVIFMGLLLAVYIIDTMTDYWFMGGFYAKNNSCLEFMQSSNYFQSFVRNVVIADIIRRILLYMVLSVLGIWIGLEKGYAKEWYQMFSYLSFLEMFLAQVVVVVGRHFVMWQYTYSCIMVGLLIISISMPVMAISVFENGIAVNVILAILMVLASVGTVWYTKKKVRDSFYDQ